MRRWALITLAVGALGCPPEAQTPRDPAPEPEPDDPPPVLLNTCDVPARLDATSETRVGRDSDGYSLPASARRVAFLDAIAAARGGNWQTAKDAAEAANYSLCRGIDEFETLVMLEPFDGTGQPVVVLREDPSVELVVGAPHAGFEAGTGEQGWLVFQQTGARALVVTGTHRCANVGESACSGTTMACDTPPERFRESDMAHVADSLFQDAHIALLQAYPDSLVVSLHGMSRSGASVSNGTTDAAGATTLVARVAEALRQEVPDANITTCNDYGGGNHEAYLCGTTNTQGRLANGSADACTMSAAALGRFVHIEQGDDVRADLAATGRALARTLAPEQ